MTRAGWLLVLLGAMGAGPAPALQGHIVFTRFGGVYQQPVDGSGPAVEIGELPDDATEVRWLEAVESGRLVVLDLGSYPVWVYAPDPAQPALVRGGPCTGRAHPSPGGGCLVCPTREGPMLVAGGRDDHAPLPGPLGDAAFLGTTGMELAGIAEEGIVGFDRTRPTEKRLLAKPGARSHLLLAPDGKRAVAVFGTGDEVRIKAFLLDGEGVPRQLGGPGYPTAWSWDSVWILFQEGDIKDAPKDDDEDGGSGSAFLMQVPRPAKGKPSRKKPVARPAESSGPLVRACVGRSTGGEVKCWEGYTGMSFSPDSKYVLLKKGTSLFVGKIAGVRPEAPAKILDNIDGAATWVPGPVAAPLPAAPQGGP